MHLLIKFLVSTLGTLLSWFFNVVVIKFLVFAVIFIVITEVVPILVEIFIPEVNLKELSGAISGDILFFIQPFALDKGIQMILSAYLTRFMIRRIPFVG